MFSHVALDITDTVRKPRNRYRIFGPQEMSSIAQLLSRILERIIWYDTESNTKLQFMCLKPKLNMSEFGIRKCLLIEKMENLIVPQIHLTCWTRLRVF